MDSSVALATASTGWHRKWLLLCAALVWLYFLRFRVLGWVLSQCATLALRFKQPQLHARVQIHHLTLRPLELGHVDISGGKNAWRVVWTLVRVETHVVDFFRSFVQKKILLVAVDDVFVDLLEPDDELLRTFHVGEPPGTGYERATPHHANEGKHPMGFMRFIDLRVRSISINIEFLETRTRFRCSDLRVDILEVMVAQNLLHLSLSASSLFLASRPLQQPSPLSGSNPRRRDSGAAGLCCELTNTQIVLDVRLTDQEIIGCTVASKGDEPAYLHVDTAYVELLLTKKRDQIRKGRFPIPQWMWQQGAASHTHEIPSASPFTLRVADFPLVMDVVHSGGGKRRKMPLQVVTHIRHLTYARNPSLEFHGESIEPATTTVKMPVPKDHGGFSMRLECQTIQLSSGVDFSHRVLSLASCRIEMDRDNASHGRLQCEIRDAQLAVNPSICEVLHSLTLFPDTIDDYERTIELLMWERVAQKLDRPAFVPKARVPVQWAMSVEVHDWSLQAWLGSGVDGWGKRDLEAHGKRTTVRSTISPQPSGRTMKHRVDLSEAHVQVSLHGAESTYKDKDYSIQFESVSVLTSMQTTPHSKSVELKLSSSSVVLNGRVKGLSLHGSGDLPGLVVSNVVFHQTETESDEITQIGISLVSADADFVTSHSRHEEIVGNLRVVLSVLDQVRIMLTPPDATDRISTPMKETAKALDVSVRASAMRGQLLDVDSVSPVVEVAFNDMKAAYQKAAAASTTTTTVTCAFLKMLWESDPVMDLASVRFHQTVTSSLMPRSGEIRCEGDVVSNSEISLSHLQLWLLPERRLLLLFLRLDELANANNNKSEMTVSTTTSAPQHVTLHCTKMGIQLRSLLADTGGTSPHSIHLDHVTGQANLNKSGKMTEAMLRYLQLTHRHESCRARLAEALQVVEMDGTLGVQSLNVVSGGESVLHVNEWVVRFATTDTSVSDGDDTSVYQQAPPPHYIPSKILLFDVSSTATQVKLTLSRYTKAAANVMLPILQTALEARPRTAVSEPLVEDPVPDWRLRFVGSLDCGIQRTVVVLPFPGECSQSQFMVVCADHLTLHCRQFQKLSVQFELLRVAITDHDAENDGGLGDDSASIGRSALGNDVTDMMPLEMLYLPRTKLDAAIHWKAPCFGSPERFAVSFDLVLRSHPLCSSEQVPFVREALCCLNWDSVFPALIHLMAEDPAAATVATHSDTPKAVECVGVQWNVSVDVVQVAAWDAMTQSDSAMLLVAQDLLSHGVARLHATGTSPPRWVLWETTVYLDLFRAYLLRDAVTEDESSTRTCGGALPFQCCDQSSFFVETTGTSYRATHDGAGDPDAERTTAAETSGSLFGELAFVMAEKLHDQFTRVEYAFAERAVGVAVPVVTTGSSPSPPKSPRAWTQSVRSKLARLKRRTSSMDNMLLNDGSRPIQVDSMKLLWTITTRDSAFHMIAAIGDCLEAVVETTRRQDSTASPSAACSVRPLSPRETTRANKDAFDASERQAKRTDTPSFDATRTGRRVSTRDSLLELLQQGKLGNKDPTASVHSHSETHSPLPSRTPRTANEEMQHLSKTIHLKTYTLDVHDVQISILDETSRSSALIASKHIHLEAGHDETEATAIATLKFEGVTGHVAPLDVEVASGVIWYSQSRTVGVGPQRMPTGHALLKQVMDEFTLTTTYSQGIASGETSVEVDMSSLQLSTDRSQFYQLLNVLRHVLLAPPTIVLRSKRQLTARRRDHVHASDDVGLVADDTSTTASPPSASTLPVYTGKKLHAQLVEELRIRDARTLGVNRSAQTLLKLISFRSAGGVIRLRTSPESMGGDHEFVEIRAEGITGSHAFFASQNTKLVLTLQWMEINNLRPGPSSIAFEDAMAVLKASLLVDPRLPQGSHQRPRLSTTNQKGMLTVRAESGPLTRVLGQKLRILDVLEISVFPEVPNMIVIQLAADFYDLLYKFFFEQVSSSCETHQETANGEQLLFGKRLVSSASAPPPLSPTTTTTHKSRAYMSPASPPHTLMGRRRSMQTSASMGSDSAVTGSTVSSPSGDSLVVMSDDDDASADGCELFYFKYVRIGNVRLRINCHGFFVNLSHFDLDLPPFVTQSRLCTWNKLLQKFESHLRWYVTKETASTGLSHFKNKLLKWTPTNSASSAAASDKKEHKHKRGAGDDSSSSATAMNAHVLFGPYSGSS